MATLGLLKIRGFSNKYNGAIISVHDFRNKILSRDSIMLYRWSCDQSVVILGLL